MRKLTWRDFSDMKKLVLLLSLSFGPAANATVIYTNLTSPYQANAGRLVSSSGGSDYSLAYSFTVTGSNFQVTNINFAAYYAGTNTMYTNEVSATIYADDGGTPGLPAGTPGVLPYSGVQQMDPMNFLYTTGPINNVLGTLAMQTVTPGAILLAGQTYWLSLDGPADGTAVGWNYAGMGISAPAAIYNGTSWMTAYNLPQGAFEIDGTVFAPEPVTTGLLVSGLAVLFAFRRKFTQ
jgi:hypothetical protein